MSGILQPDSFRWGLQTGHNAQPPPDQPISQAVQGTSLSCTTKQQPLQQLMLQHPGCTTATHTQHTGLESLDNLPQGLLGQPAQHLLPTQVPWAVATSSPEYAAAPVIASADQTPPGQSATDPATWSCSKLSLNRTIAKSTWHRKQRRCLQDAVEATEPRLKAAEEKCDALQAMVTHLRASNCCLVEALAASSSKWKAAEAQNDELLCTNAHLTKTVAALQQHVQQLQQAQQALHMQQVVLHQQYQCQQQQQLMCGQLACPTIEALGGVAATTAPYV